MNKFIYIITDRIFAVIPSLLVILSLIESIAQFCKGSLLGGFTFAAIFCACSGLINLENNEKQNDND